MNAYEQPGSAPLDTSRSANAGAAKEGNVKASPVLKLLFIAHHFSPENVMSAARAAAFAKYLPRHGIEVTVLTRAELARTAIGHQSAGPQAGVDKCQHFYEGSRVVRILHTRRGWQTFLDKALQIPMVSMIVAFSGNLLGFFTLHAVHSYIALKKAIKEHPELREYDAVLITTSPHEFVRLGAWINRRYGLPFIADYRDSFDNRLLSRSFRPNWRERIGIYLKRHYHRQWMRNCSLLVSVSRPLLQVLTEELRVKDSVEVRNGFDPDLLTPDPAEIDRNYFRLIYSGRIYPHQDLAPFLQAMSIFLARLSSDEREQVRLAFYGVADRAHANTLNRHFGDRANVITARVSQDEIHRALAASCILLIFDYGQVGVYSGKLMEYAGMNRNILKVPSDSGVMDDLIHQGRFGMATSDPYEAADFLIQRFREWKRDGAPHCAPKTAVVEALSMSNQTARLANAIKAIVQERRAPKE